MKQNQISKLPQLQAERYENLFTVHTTDDGYYYYNILNKVSFPNNLSPSILGKFTVRDIMPWTTLSYRLYGTQHLWWLICCLNKIQNPLKMLAPGSSIIVIKPEYINSVLEEIKW